MAGEALVSATQCRWTDHQFQHTTYDVPKLNTLVFQTARKNWTLSPATNEGTFFFPTGNSYWTGDVILKTNTVVTFIANIWPNTNIWKQELNSRSNIPSTYAFPLAVYTGTIFNERSEEYISTRISFWPSKLYQRNIGPHSISDGPNFFFSNSTVYKLSLAVLYFYTAMEKMVVTHRRNFFFVVFFFPDISLTWLVA